MAVVLFPTGRFSQAGVRSSNPKGTQSCCLFAGRLGTAARGPLPGRLPPQHAAEMARLVALFDAQRGAAQEWEARATAMVGDLARLEALAAQPAPAPGAPLPPELPGLRDELAAQRQQPRGWPPPAEGNKRPPQEAVESPTGHRKGNE